MARLTFYTKDLFVYTRTAFRGGSVSRHQEGPSEALTETLSNIRIVLYREVQRGGNIGKPVNQNIQVLFKERHGSVINAELPSNIQYTCLLIFYRCYLKAIYIIYMFVGIYIGVI